MNSSTPEKPAFRTKVIKDGNSVAVRIPASLGLKPGEVIEVEIHRIDIWPEGFFDLEPSPDFPFPARTNPKVREARKRKLFGGEGSGE